MLQQLSLTNFRRHENLTVDFTQGIQVIRAVNEGGKTTLTEAIGYALFGSKALRTTLDDTVTWTHDVKTLKVELSITHGGDSYSFSRSKGGAEITKNGVVFCTGQNEVSLCAATLLGADSAIASKLMFASQNGIRGSLEEGPRALSSLIEDLAGFNAFDTILEAAQNKLALGSPALLEERLKGAEATLVAATETLPAMPVDPSEKIAQISDTITDTEATLEPLRLKVEDATETHRAASLLFLKRIELEKKVETATDTLDAAVAQVESLTPAANVEVDASQIELLKQHIVAADGWTATCAAYRKFSALPEGERFTGPAEEFETVMAFSADQRRRVTDFHTAAREKIAQWKYKRIDHDTCSKCGQDITHLDTVKSTNAEVDAALAELAPFLAERQSELAQLSAQDENDSLIRRFAVQFQKAFTGLEHYATLNSDTYPPTATWNGEVPGNVGPAAPREKLKQIELSIAALASAKSKLELAQEQESKAKVNLANAIQALEESQAPDADTILTLTEEKENAILSYSAAQGTIILAKQEIETLSAAYNSAKALWAMSQARIDDAQKVITACRSDLDSLGFNNSLVKKLRAIRPVIANKLWNTVLASVSVMFSQMRGTPSAVTKEKAGFQVNGQAIESLSGSTLDVLGIALRCSMLRTFLPNCSLLVLDEPAQGCDESRTEALLGFLQSVGMGQTLLITHETVSESIADNIIEL